MLWRLFILIMIIHPLNYAVAQSLHSKRWDTQTACMWNRMQRNVKNNHFFIGMYNDGREALDEQGILQVRNDFYASSLSRISRDFKSDFKRIAGKYPSMIETDFFSHAINKVNKSDREYNKNNLINYIIHYYNIIGGLVSLSCHIANPRWYVEQNGYVADYRYVSSKHPNVVADILDGQIKLNAHQTVRGKFDEQLDEFIEMIKQLKDKDGNKIPVVIRLFHESSESWFWWGIQYCSNQEYKKLFRYTVDRITSQCNNVMVAYAPDKNWSSMDVADKFLSRYPGNNYVDIVGYDNYGINDDSIHETVHQLQLLSLFANKNNKVAALTETGNLALKIPRWFTKCLQPCLTACGVNLAYVQIYGSWSSVDGFFFPFRKNSREAKDFRRFFRNKRIIKIRKTNF